MVTSTCSVFLLFSSYLLSSVSSLNTACYVIDGTLRANAGFRCDNLTTGDSACCAAGATCYSNGLCKQDNGQIVDFLRVGCTDPTWQAAECLDQCTKYATSSSAGVRFCGGDITKTTSYCCDDGSNGPGSFACCNYTSSIFQISPAATVLAQMPLSQLSSTSTTSSTTSSTSTSSPSTTTTSSSHSGSSTNTTAIGAGVGVPLGLLALAGIGYFFWRRRNQKRAQTYELQTGEGPFSGGYGGAAGAGGGHQYENEYDQHGQQYGQGANAMYHDAVNTAYVGNAMGQKKGYFGGQGYEAASGGDGVPMELENREVRLVHELGP